MAWVGFIIVFIAMILAGIGTAQSWPLKFIPLVALLGFVGVIVWLVSYTA